MDKPVTIKEVAARAGVSIATASRVLTGHKATSPQAREAVNRAARELHYLPNGLASSLRSAQTGTIGLLVSDIRNPFFSELAYVIQTALFELGYCTMVGNASEQEVLQDQYLTALRRQRVAGLICAPQGSGSDVLNRIAKDGLPMVFVDRSLPLPGVPSVNSDPEPGIRQALAAFHAAGHRRIGFVAGPQGTSTGVERLEVFTRLAADGFDSASVAAGGYDQQLCGANVAELISSGCTALLFGYSPNAITALQVIDDLGLRVPHDLSLVSFDEIPFFELVSPPVSVIQQGIAAMGQQAVELLIQVMAGEQPLDRRLPSSLIIRDTVGPAPTRRGPQR